jgi:hypothetical protein
MYKKEAGVTLELAGHLRQKRSTVKHFTRSLLLRYLRKNYFLVPVLKIFVDCIGVSSPVPQI